MATESLVMLHPEPVTHRLLTAAASQCAENPLVHYPRTLERPEVLQVRCTEVEPTDYGLIRLVLNTQGPSLAVSVRPELVMTVLDSENHLPIGFLTE